MSTAFGAASTYAGQVVVQNDGRIVVSSGVWSATRDIGLTRYNSDGTLDDSFGTGGIVQLDVNVGSDDRSGPIVLVADGKVLLYGIMDGDLLLIRFNVDGSVDTDFGTNGYTTVDVLTGESESRGDLVVRPNGKIVVVCTNDGDNGNGFGTVLQFSENGILDPAFGTSGLLTIDWATGTTTEWLRDLALASNGDIYMVGYTSIVGTDIIQVYRVNAAGALDTGFDGDGMMELPVGPDRDQPNSINVLASGKILIGGITESDLYYDIFFALLNADGSFDPSFGTSGMVITSISAGYVTDVLPMADGKFLFCSDFFNGVGRDMLIARMDADGSFDTSYGTDGITTTRIGSQGGSETGISLAIAADGNYIMTGRTGVDFNQTVVQIVLKYRSGVNSSIREEAEERMRVFPNPTNGSLLVNSVHPNRSKGYLVLDTSGRSMVEVIAINGQLELPSSLDAGNYLLVPADRSVAPHPFTLVR